MFNQLDNSLSLKAVSISSSLKPYLRAGIKTQVHSVFKNSFNCLDDNGRFITIADKKTGNIPNGILVDNPSGGRFGSLGLEKGMLAESMDNLLLFPELGISICLDNAEIWPVHRRLDKSFLPIKAIKANLLCVERLVGIKTSKSSLGMLVEHSRHLFRADIVAGDNALDHFNQIFFNPVSDLIQGIKTHNFEKIQTAVSKLIGLGVGLTPSGDDILLGVISSLTYLGYYLRKSEYVLRVSELVSRLAKGKTTIVSQTYLQYAARGEISEVLADMLEAVLTSSVAEVRSAALNVMSIGSTSGKEITFGVLLGLELGIELFGVGRN